MHALEHRSGREILMWRDELHTTTRPPFDAGPDDVVIAYSAMAESTCMRRLGWPRPNIICPFTELMALNNGLAEGADKQPGLIRAVEMLGGTPPITSAYKTMMRDKILSGQFERAEVEAYITAPTR
jgi:hypothetical protein